MTIVREIPLFCWAESLLSTDEPLQLTGTELAVDVDYGGAGKADSEGIRLFTWRATSSTSLDFGLTSLSDARASTWRSAKLNSTPAKNGVLVTHKGVLFIMTVSGEIFVISDCFASSRPHGSIISTKFLPTSCCWVYESKFVQCWVGSEQGEVQCLVFTSNGKFINKVSSDALRPGGWLGNLTRLQKRPILAISTLQQPDTEHSVAILSSEGRAVLMKLEQPSNDAKTAVIVTTGPEIVLEGHQAWTFGEVFVLRSCRIRQHEIIFWAWTDDGRAWACSKSSWSDSSLLENSRLELDNSINVRGFLASDDNSTLCVTWDDIHDRVCVSNGDFQELEGDFSQLDRPYRSLRPILANVGAFLSPADVSFVVSKTFLVRGDNAINEAASKFDAKGSNEERAVFADLFRINSLNKWKESSALLAISSDAPSSTLGLLVRRRGLGILVQMGKTTQDPLTDAMESLWSAVPHDSIRGAIDDGNLDIVLIRHIASTMPISQNFQAQVRSSFRSITELQQALAKSFADSVKAENQNELRRAGEVSSSVNGVLLGELLRFQAKNVVNHRVKVALLALVSLCRVFTQSDDATAHELRLIAYASLEDAQRAGLVWRILRDLNTGQSKLRKKRISVLDRADLFGDGEVGSISQQRLFEADQSETEESNLAWAWAQEVRFAVNLTGDRDAWVKLNRLVLRQFAPWELNQSSGIVLKLLSRPDDTPILKTVLAALQREAHKVDLRRLTIMSACCELWAATQDGRAVDKSDTRELFLAGAPSQKVAVYYSEVAKLFDRVCPSLELFFIHCASLFGPYDDHLVRRAFLAALAADNHNEALAIVMGMGRDESDVKKDFTKRLMISLIQSGKLDNLLQLSLRSDPIVFDEAIQVLKSTISQSPDVVTDKTFQVLYSFFMQNHLYAAACDLGFLRFDSTLSRHQGALSIDAANLCLAASAMLPAGASISIHRQGAVMSDQLVRGFALAKVISAFQSVLRRVNDGTSGIPKRPQEIFEFCISWLQNHFRKPMKDIGECDLLLALYEMSLEFQLSVGDTESYYLLLGERYNKVPGRMDELFQFMIKASRKTVGERRVAASHLLKIVCSSRHPIPDWWQAVFLTEFNSVHIFVETLSDTGHWLKATCAAVDMIPTKLDLDNPAEVNVRVIDKILSRALRYKHDSYETTLVVDIPDTRTSRIMREVAREIEDKLRSYFILVQRNAPHMGMVRLN